MSPIRTLLVAVDFSEHSDAALDAAIDLARGLGAEVHLVHSYELHMPMVTPYEVAIPAPYIEETRAAAAAQLDERAKKVAAAGIGVHTHLAETPAPSAIAHAAERIGADLVVMGTRGHTGLKHLVLGSVAERTLRMAPCSVLTVKSKS